MRQLLPQWWQSSCPKTRSTLFAAPGSVEAEEGSPDGRGLRGHSCAQLCTTPRDATGRDGTEARQKADWLRGFAGQERVIVEKFRARFCRFDSCAPPLVNGVLARLGAVFRSTSVGCAQFVPTFGGWIVEQRYRPLPAEGEKWAYATLFASVGLMETRQPLPDFLDLARVLFSSALVGVQRSLAEGTCACMLLVV